MNGFSRKQTLDINKKIVLEKLIELRKSTISKLAPILEWSTGKVQGIIQHLLKENKIIETVYPDLERRVIKVYYSTEILDMGISTPKMQQGFEIPKYYNFLDKLFGMMLSSEKSDILMDFIDDLGMDINDIISMQKESKKGVK